ncbi:MAG: hypothetical protein ACOYOU_10305 [Kiritimatiellia bacterium]
MLTALTALSVMGSGSAFAATNAVPYADSFESRTNGSIVNAITGWASGPNDLSVITNYSPNIPACGAPIAGTHTNVLKLSTEDTILTNNVGVGDGNPFDMTSVITYVDTMVQFVPSGDTPTALPNGAVNDKIKAAFYVDSQTNLVIYHGVLNFDGSSIVWSRNTNEVINIPLNATNWYRVTVALDATARNYIQNNNYSDWGAMFQIKTNGVAVQSTNAYGDTWKADWTNDVRITPLQTGGGGTWFPFATDAGTLANGTRQLSALCFQGTGYIDDLVVTTAEPSYVSALSSYLLTVFRGNNGSSDLGVNPLTQVQVAANSSTTIVYTAAQWYKIASFSSTSNGVNPEGMSVYTQHLYNIAANVSNNVSFNEKSTGAIVPGVPSSYATSNGFNEAYAIANSNAVQQGYMLGLAPTTNGMLTVSAINVNGTNLSVTVQLNTNSVSVDTTINGTLWVLATTNLSVGFTGAYTADLPGAAFTNGGKHVVSFYDAASNKFYKAQITLP